jgi:hypothetical protein
MMSAPFYCQAESIGLEARRLLTSPGFSGKVLAVVSRTIYLQSDGDEILWVVKGGLPMHRRSLLASFPSSSYDPGKRFFVRESCLHIGEQAVVDLEKATHWNQRSAEPGEEASPPFLAALVRKTLTALCGLANPKGLGKALPVISAIAAGRTIPPLAPDSLVKEALNPIIEAAEACLARDLPGAVRKSWELVGLGGGLTPSGDDFLGGLLFAAHALHESYPGRFHWDPESILYSIKQAREQTNPISHVLLSDLALGHGPEPLHEVIAALITGRNRETVMNRVIRLTGIGSTSGWDMLTGLMTGMLLLEGGMN